MFSNPDLLSDCLEKYPGKVKFGDFPMEKSPRLPLVRFEIYMKEIPLVKKQITCQQYHFGYGSTKRYFALPYLTLSHATTLQHANAITAAIKVVR